MRKESVLWRKPSALFAVRASDGPSAGALSEGLQLRLQQERHMYFHVEEEEGEVVFTIPLESLEAMMRDDRLDSSQ